jgi:nucleotide-binding universal stress UspA family protein
MTREELRASLEAKSIIMPKWPAVGARQLLVMNEWGCSEDLIDILPTDDAASAAEDAAVEWAEAIDRNGGWTGNPYPYNTAVYVIDHAGNVREVRLGTDFEPHFVATAVGAAHG